MTAAVLNGAAVPVLGIVWTFLGFVCCTPVQLLENPILSTSRNFFQQTNTACFKVASEIHAEKFPVICKVGKNIFCSDTGGEDSKLSDVGLTLSIMHFLSQALVKSLRCLVSCLDFWLLFFFPRRLRWASAGARVALRHNSVSGELVAEEL